MGTSKAPGHAIGTSSYEMEFIMYPGQSQIDIVLSVTHDSGLREKSMVYQGPAHGRLVVGDRVSGMEWVAVEGLRNIRLPT